jgi:adenylate cyclase class IV
MHNVEFKAEVRDMDLARGICRRAGATFIARLEQVDTYYRVASGRLKRRETRGEATEFIYYERANRTHPKLSHFAIYTEAQAEARFGSEMPPVLVVVSKVRELYMLGRVRVHLDRVEGLGTFLEFEALVSRENTIVDAHAALADLRSAFAPALGEALATSYSDMLLREVEDAPRPELPG